jgi:hypothetical protein
MRFACICTTLSPVHETLDNLQNGKCSMDVIVHVLWYHWLTVIFKLPLIVLEDTYSLDIDMNIW